MPGFLLHLCLATVLVFLVTGGDSPTPHPNQGADKAKRTKEPDAAAIARLVGQLSSPKFTERQQATKALEAIGFPALDALRKAAKSADTELARRASRLVKTIENGFDQLLADYRAYGLPLPPGNAKLVRFEPGGGFFRNDKLPPAHFLGFLLRPGTKHRPPILLVGTEEIRLEADTPVEAVEPKPALLTGIDSPWWGRATFEANTGLAIALQCKSRGWHGLAQKLWALGLKQDIGQGFGGAFNQPANLSNRSALAYLAWAYSGNELVNPDTDRTRTAKRMKALLAVEPQLNTEVNRELLKSLEAALVPSTARRGSVERMIDDLTETCNTRRQGDEDDPRYSRLGQKGFAVVPALIEHLDDDRLTRSVRPGFNNFPPRILRVKDVVSDLLRELAGEEVGEEWLQRQHSYMVERTDARAWWVKARKEGEEAYLLAHVLPGGKEANSPNRLMLSIITERYPKYLPKLYKANLNERPKMQSWPLAEAVARSALPKEKKRELFLQASRHKTLEHRRVGLSQLQKLDPQRFITILLKTLDGLPKSTTGPYWSCPEADFAEIVLETDDPRAWAMLEKVAKRSDVGLRMEFINIMDYSTLGSRQRRQRLKFLAAFLDDAEAPDVKANLRMFNGPDARFAFRRPAVRDLAAMEIVSILAMPDQPDRDWTPQQWEKLRNNVKEALKKAQGVR